MGLLQPPSHRGPLIAAGAVVLTVGLALVQVRFDEDAWTNTGHLLLVAPAAALLLWLGLQARLEGGRPPAYQSALLVCGLLVLAVALLRLADALGADFEDFPGSGALTWTGAVEAGVAAFAAARRNSAICALLAAVAGGGAVLAAANWIFGADSVTTYRWLLLLLAVVFTIACLPLRAISLRHSQQMINAAGLSILIIALMQGFSFFLGFGGEPLPGFWEIVVVATGFSLIAYSAADRAPGPAYIGALILLAFVGVSAPEGDTLKWWPIVLLLLGAGAMLAGLRPRSPLPPEPAPYHADDLPLAARTDDDVVVRVRAD